MKILFLVTEDWYFCSHRLELAQACIEQGHNVYLLTNVNKHAEIIKSNNIELRSIPFPRSFKKPWLDILTLFQIYRHYKIIKPDIVHHVAMKPVLYGSSIGLILFKKRPRVIVNAITGLGSVFISENRSITILRKIVRNSLSFFLNRPNSLLIVQNNDDYLLFKDDYNINKNKIKLIRGSGVNVRKFISSNKRVSGKPVVMFVARILRDKGIVEFIEAAKNLEKQSDLARFIIVGQIDNQNPSGVGEEELKNWLRDVNVEWWGESNDMTSVYEQADIIVLPSYREGLPKVLLEAASCGLPIITTNVPGCREIIKHEENGLLVPPMNSVLLAQAMKRLILDAGLRSKLGNNARKRIEAEFSSEIIIKQTLSLYMNSLENLTTK